MASLAGRRSRGVCIRTSSSTLCPLREAEARIDSAAARGALALPSAGPLPAALHRWTSPARFGSNSVGVPVCTERRLTKPLDAFTPIRGTSGFCGRCNARRARRALERAHPGLNYVDRKASKERPPAAVDRESREGRPRLCTDCRGTKPVAEFVPIRACKQDWYGWCRACRAKRARERYQTDPHERELQKARVRRNRLRRRAQSQVGQAG
jgi:hypothetical protein